MSKVFAAYAQRKGVAITSLRFLIDGDRIDAAETPKSLELEDQDQSKCAGRVFLSFLFTLQRNYEITLIVLNLNFFYFSNTCCKQSIVCLNKPVAIK